MTLEEMRQALLKALAFLQSRMKPQSRITEWAEAIKIHEGWFPPSSGHPVGSRSWRNNNPGNIKFGPYARTWLDAYGEDDKGFARFYSYDDGFEGLCRYLRDVAGWHMIPYKAYAKKHGIPPEAFNLYHFFDVYAPASDNNAPRHYAEVVAKRIGVAPETPIKNLL
jgi:hypothetical protein